MKALLGLGTNIGCKTDNLKMAIDSLNLVPNINVIKESCIYDTAPWGYQEQDNFYNMVCEIETSLTPNALLGVCLGIEAAMGRIRTIKNGPRVIDIDVLLCEGFTLDTEELTVPHPLMGERDFVLVPMKDMYDSMIIYGFDYAESYEKIIRKSSAKKLKKFENKC